MIESIVGGLFFLFVVGAVLNWISSGLDGMAAERQRQRTDSLNTKYSEILSAARERARIAFPDYLDSEEINNFLDDDQWAALPNSDRDYQQIWDAQKLLSYEPSLVSEDEVELFESVSEGIGQKPDVELGEPSRIIDCGAAGKLELFSAEVVNFARNDAGVDKFIADLGRFRMAHKKAVEVAQRYKDFERQRQRDDRARIDALTTTLDELPPLPRRKK